MWCLVVIEIKGLLIRADNEKISHKISQDLAIMHNFIDIPIQLGITNIVSDE